MKKDECKKCPVKNPAGGFWYGGETCVRCKAGVLPEATERTEAEK